MRADTPHVSMPFRPALRALLVALAILLASAPAGAAVPPGLADPGQAGHAAKCQKMLNKGVAKYLAVWSKTYGKCVGAIASCVQTKASDPECLAKALATCDKLIPKLGDDTDKDAGTVLENLVTSFCGSLTPDEQLDDVGGFRYRLRESDCHDRFGIPSLDTGGGRIANCLFQETNCVAEKLLLAQTPRARDLLATAGVAIGNAVTSPKSCLVDEGGAGDLGDPKTGKALLACEKGAAKAGVGFAAKARAAFAKCADAVMACAQLKPTQKCVDAAAKTCAKATAAVDGAQTKADDAVVKACGKILVDDLLSANGGDAGALGPLCNGVGVGAGTITSVGEYADCLVRHERCQVEDSIRFTAPRIEEFFVATLQPSPFGSTSCPTP